MCIPSFFFIIFFIFIKIQYCSLNYIIIKKKDETINKPPQVKEISIFNSNTVIEKAFISKLKNYLLLREIK